MAQETKLYDILGVSSDASQEEIKKAYRKRARETHPDANGGKDGDFAKVSEAYEILSDPEKRKEYDRTGDSKGAGKPENREAKVRQRVTQVFTGIIEEANPDTIDIIEMMLKVFGDKIREAEREKSRTQKKIDKYNKVKENLLGPQDGFLWTVLDKSLDDLNGYYRDVEDDKLLMEEARDFVQEYRYVPEPEEPRTSSSNGTVGALGVDSSNFM